MKYAIQFGLLSALAVAAAVATAAGWAVTALFIWAAVAFAVVALAYVMKRPGLLMKRADGSQAVTAWLVLWPYLLLTRFTLRLYRATHRRTAACAEVRPGLWFSRRLTTDEIESAEVGHAAVLDLAAEFPKTPGGATRYRSLPVLDGTAPSPDQLHAAVNWIDEQIRLGPVRVHCALGHGRTGTVVISWLLAHGHVTDVRAGAALLTGRRSTFGLSDAQAESVERFIAEQSWPLHGRTKPPPAGDSRQP